VSYAMKRFSSTVRYSSGSQTRSGFDGSKSGTVLRTEMVTIPDYISVAWKSLAECATDVAC